MEFEEWVAVAGLIISVTLRISNSVRCSLRLYLIGGVAALLVMDLVAPYQRTD